MLRALALRLLPPRCVVCELAPSAPSTSICTSCEAEFFSPDIERCRRCAIRITGALTESPRICGRCQAAPPHFDATTTLADYVSPVDGMIVALKFTARLDLADFFGRLLARRLPPVKSSDNAVVMPVPLAYERVRQRGFNQSHHIARAFADVTGLRLIGDRLLRIRHTPAQQSLALDERRHNVRGAFAIEGAPPGPNVFVVDDVMTTGSTLDEIARVLKQVGATRVHNLIVARTP